MLPDESACYRVPSVSAWSHGSHLEGAVMGEIGLALFLVAILMSEIRLSDLGVALTVVSALLMSASLAIKVWEIMP